MLGRPYRVQDLDDQVAVNAPHRQVTQERHGVIVESSRPFANLIVLLPPLLAGLALVDISRGAFPE
jgi:hypothetical protein